MTIEPASPSGQNETCSSRRGVLKGASALALATAALRMRPVLAEDGTPVASPAGDEARPATWLFTQTFRSGDWARTDDPTHFTLHLRGGLASTVGFTDRPNRDFDVAPTIDFIPALWNNPDNPPNAAIIVEDAGIQYTYLLVLTDPSYDEAADEITYTVSVLESYEGDGLGEVVERVADGTLPQTFGAGALFIDSLAGNGCEYSVKVCRRYKMCDSGFLGKLSDEFLEESKQSTASCWKKMSCKWPCEDEQDYWNDWCNGNFNEWCYAKGNRWGCVFTSEDAVQNCCRQEC
jgi:hypothetical protein